MTDPEIAMELTGVSHAYDGTTVLRDVDLKVEKGEFLTLLGPSGCGKTTLLRSIAGFVRPRAGRIVVHGTDVTKLPANRRPVNTVSQRPTLLPHLDVRRNVELGLRLDGVAKGERARSAEGALEMVGLGGYGKRRPHELSGGQMQRVALARALVKRPDVLLLDEPLSALDLKIRLSMESELRRIHRETGATFVYVTHDQREAMALSSRVAVMQEGSIEQCAAPEELCARPATVFTARFVGDSNVIPARVVAAGSETCFDGSEIVLPVPGAAEGPAWLALRPEVIVPTSAGEGAIDGAVVDVAFRGSGYSYVVEVPGLAEPVKLETTGKGRLFELGSPIGLTWSPNDLWVLGRDPGAEAAPQLVAQTEGAS